MSTFRQGNMICFDDAASRFQVRAAGIALREARVLLQRAVGDQFWALPGGRMEQGETSSETVLREMQEELLQTVQVGALAFIVESFFSHSGRDFHEVGFFHPIAVPEAFPFAAEGICHRVRDGTADVEFAWLPADEVSLRGANFRPEPLQPLLGVPSGRLIHIVNREESVRY